MARGLQTLAVVGAVWAVTYLPFAFASDYGLIPEKHVTLIWLSVSWLTVVCAVGYFIFKDRRRR